MSPSAARLIANSLRVASADLEASRTLHATNNRNAIYPCEQAAEKVILAVLKSENQHGEFVITSTPWSTSYPTRTRSSRSFATSRR